MNDSGVGANDSTSSYIRWALAIVVVLLTTFGLGPFWWYGVPQDLATFGDSFGLVNALFSGLAFAFVIAAILMQRDELRLQRNELRLQREQMEQSVEQQRRSAEAQAKSEQMLFLAAYLRALDLQREINSQQDTDRLDQLQKRTRRAIAEETIDKLLGEMDRQADKLYEEVEFTPYSSALWSNRELLRHCAALGYWFRSLDKHRISTFSNLIRSELDGLRKTLMAVIEDDMRDTSELQRIHKRVTLMADMDDDLLLAPNGRDIIKEITDGIIHWLDRHFLD